MSDLLRRDQVEDCLQHNHFRIEASGDASGRGTDFFAALALSVIDETTPDTPIIASVGRATDDAVREVILGGLAREATKYQAQGPHDLNGIGTGITYRRRDAGTVVVAVLTADTFVRVDLGSTSTREPDEATAVALVRSVLAGADETLELV